MSSEPGQDFLADAVALVENIIAGRDCGEHPQCAGPPDHTCHCREMAKAIVAQLYDFGWIVEDDTEYSEPMAPNGIDSTIYRCMECGAHFDSREDAVAHDAVHSEEQTPDERQTQ